MQLFFIIHTAEKYAFKSGLVVKDEQITLMQELPAVTGPDISTLGNSVVYFTSCKAYFSIGILRNKGVE